VSGTWRDPLTGNVFTSPGQVQIDHLVALADAHRSGGWAWTTTQKRAFANDLTNPELNALGSAENNRKSNKGPDEYTPPLPAARCWYARAYIAVKRAWSLTVTAAQYIALANHLTTC